MFRLEFRTMRWGQVMLPLTIAAYTAGCAKPSTVVLEPYALADGTMYQDVITMAADERGTAPVVTHIKTFELRTGYKGGTKPTAPVAAASGSAPGLVSTVTGAAVSAGISAATSAAIARSGWNRSRINNSTTVSSNNTNNQSGGGEAAPISITNNNNNTNSNISTNTNDNSSSNDAINSNILNGS